MWRHLGRFDLSVATRVTVQNESFTVLDDVLGPEQRDALWNYFQWQPFQRIDALGMQGQWPLEDSGILRGPTVGWDRLWDAQYPTKTPLDHLLKAGFDPSDTFARPGGQLGEPWNAFRP